MHTKADSPVNLARDHSRAQLEETLLLWVTPSWTVHLIPGQKAQSSTCPLGTYPGKCAPPLAQAPLPLMFPISLTDEDWQNQLLVFP